MLSISVSTVIHGLVKEEIEATLTVDLCIRGAGAGCDSGMLVSCCVNQRGMSMGSG